MYNLSKLLDIFKAQFLSTMEIILVECFSPSTMLMKCNAVG